VLLPAEKAYNSLTNSCSALPPVCSSATNHLPIEEKLLKLTSKDVAFGTPLSPATKEKHWEIYYQNNVIKSSLTPHVVEKECNINQTSISTNEKKKQQEN
jgi:hypothetical protein